MRSALFTHLRSARQTQRRAYVFSESSRLERKMEYCICKTSRVVLAFAFVALAAERSFAGTGNILKEGSSGSSSAAAAAYYGGNQAALSQLPTTAPHIFPRPNPPIPSLQPLPP